MAAETTIQPVSRDILEDRWKLLMRGVTRFQGEAAITATNSKRWQRVNDTLEELGAMLVDEVLDHEVDVLLELIEGIWEEIERRMLDWAVAVDAARAARAPR